MSELALRNEQSVVPAASSIMEVIDRAARDPSVDVGKLERLLAMYDKIASRQAETAYSAAMNAAQEEMRPVSQDASNPQTRSKYASFAALDNAIRPIYARHGFSLSFDTGDGAPESYVRVICKVAHKSGHSERPHLDMPADGKGAKGGDVMTKTHATMSAVSYAKRGLLKMVFNIAEGEHDDDGDGAGGALALISAAQAQTIRELLEKTKGDVEKFCKAFGIGAVPDLPTARYEEAIQRINLRGVKTMSER